MTTIILIVNFKESMNIYTYYGNIEHLKAFDNDYQLKSMYTPPINNQRRPLKKISERICRFCGKKCDATTFKSKPHIISRLFGNNSAVSDYECDKCIESIIMRPGSA